MHRFAAAEKLGRSDRIVVLRWPHGHPGTHAYLLFRERDLGSIEAGKLADLAVLDRDYLTVPADQIKDITSVMTIVGGRVVHDAGVKSQ